jgi:hypothetical protein
VRQQSHLLPEDRERLNPVGQHLSYPDNIISKENMPAKNELGAELGDGRILILCLKY